MMYFPFWLLIEASQMRRYHKKLCFVVRTKHLLNLMDVELLHVVTRRTEILAWIELCGLVSEDLTNSCCHGETRVRVDVDLANCALSGLAELLLRNTYSSLEGTTELVDCVNLVLGN